MIKRIIKFVILSALGLGFLYPLAWILSRGGLFGDSEFGYYGDFNLAKRAIGQSGCIESMSYGLHEDITLEDFRFFIRTEAGWKAELWFNESMDVRQVCENPKGILVEYPFRYGPTIIFQVYSLEKLSELLKDKDIQLKNIRDILCNLNHLAPIFEENYDNEAFPLTTGLSNEFDQYIVFESLPLHKSALPVTRLKPLEIGEARVKLNGVQLKVFEFDNVTLDSAGKVIEKRKGRARFYIEDLGSGVTLEMVEIPSGTFTMGTSVAEVEHYVVRAHRDKGHIDNVVREEMPKHAVTVPGFFMGMFEVTQAQWRAVAQMPKVKRDLESEPSGFRGDDLPVEQVSWEDAVEFCERLTRATGREYRLPSEAEWEYACRARTTTPFHFGETITAEFVNYNGHYPFGSAFWGKTRGQTIPVGSLGVANGFGLYDMHGNVWEWCMDAYHQNYEGAPADGGAWAANGDSRIRVKRGGSFGDPAFVSRAAIRSSPVLDFKSFGAGFRVVAVIKDAAKHK
jgi:formylglycine-generating enzyme required for sulfatase activity